MNNGTDNHPAARPHPPFLALDFETANNARNSACALGLARVENKTIVKKETWLIKPPSSYFEFTYIHGITWDQVRNQPTFGELWPAIRPMFEGVAFLAAHNSPFDQGVLRACCETYKIPYPDLPFKCTVRISRKLWNIYPTKLPNVCAHFGIRLNHHDAGSDTEACARIMIEAVKTMEELAEG